MRSASVAYGCTRLEVTMMKRHNLVLMSSAGSQGSHSGGSTGSSSASSAGARSDNAASSRGSTDSSGAMRASGASAASGAAQEARSNTIADDCVNPLSQESSASSATRADPGPIGVSSDPGQVCQVEKTSQEIADIHNEKLAQEQKRLHAEKKRRLETSSRKAPPPDAQPDRLGEAPDEDADTAPGKRR